MKQRSFVKRLGYDALRVICRLGAVLLFRIRVVGRENYPQQGPALVCSNHQSHFDPVLVGLTCDRRLNYIARKSLFRFFLLRWLIVFLDAIPLDRDGFSLGGIKETLKRLRQDEMVLIFPEGTRSVDGEMGAIKPGVAALARRGKAPLAPVGIDGAYDAWPRRLRWPRLSVIHIHIGPPLTPEAIADLSDEQLLMVLDDKMRECFEAARKSRASASRSRRD